MGRQKRQEKDEIREANIFDNIQYYQDEMARLYGVIYELEQERSTLLKSMGRLESETEFQRSEIERLMVIIKNYESLDDEVKIPLLRIVNHCKNCETKKEVEPIRKMLYIVLRCIGRPSDYELIDSIDEAFREREKKKKNSVTYNNSTIYQGGSVHDDKSRKMNLEQRNDKLLTGEE